jgi:hypothetical protein
MESERGGQCRVQIIMVSIVRQSRGFSWRWPPRPGGRPRYRKLAVCHGSNVAPSEGKPHQAADPIRVQDEGHAEVPMPVDLHRAQRARIHVSVIGR